VKRGVVVGLGVIVVGAATVALWTPVKKWRARSALEQAASDACACMLGRHGSDVEAELLAVRAGIIAKPDPPDRLWPARCKSWNEAAIAAHGAAARANVVAPLSERDTWESRGLLEARRPFWILDPDPRVPLPEVGTFALNEEKLVPIVEGDLALRIASDKLEVGDALRIDRDDKLEHVDGTPPSFAKHPTWRAVDGEDGAKRFWTDGAFFYDDAGRAIGKEWFTSLVWARSFADGRLVAHVYVSTLEESHGEIWEYASGKKLARVAFERGVPENAKSTTSVDQWMLFKHASEDGNSVVAAIDFGRGVAAEPVVLGPTYTTNRVLARSYGTCRAHGTFVDMDPSLAIRTKDGWKFAKLDQPANRNVSCEGDVAMITEWIPLEIRRCTEDGCAIVPFPKMDVGPDDAFAADEHHVFQMVRDGGAVGVHVYDLANPSNAHHVAILPRAWETRLRVVAGRAIVLVRRDRLAPAKWSAISVHADGTVHAISPM
jgi:hypothetical protein